MIVVTTPTGNIGSEVVKQLLDAGEAVRVIARDPAKLDADLHGKVQIVQGAHDDEAVLNQALEGAESLFLVVPPLLNAPDTTEYYLSFARPAARALLRQGVTRAVSVSGLGQGVAIDAGPVSASFAKDAEIERTGIAYRALWCPSFMENALMQIDALKHQGRFFLPEPPDLKAPQVATRDIAASGVKLLLDRSWTDQGGLAVLGPEDLSNDDLAAIMTNVLGTPIRFQSIPGDAYKAQLMQHGASESFADGLVKMHAAKAQRLDNAEPRTQENTTPTHFHQWCEEVLKPAFQG